MNLATPVGWERMRVDHVTREIRDMVDPETLGNEMVFHYSIPSIQQRGDGLEEPASEIASLKVSITDDVVLVSKLNPDQGIVLSARPRNRVTLASSEFVPLRPSGIDRRFLEYLFRSHGVRCDLVSRTQSATKSHRRAKPDDIRKTWFAMPPLPTQRIIATYLDSETSRIDSLIDRKQRFIDLLLEKRTALITHAVTKGLDPDVEMKESGVGWVGEIPADWTVARVKHLFREVSDLSTTGDETLLSVSEYFGVKPRADVVEEGDFLSRAETFVGYKRLRANDLAMNIMLAWKTGLGFSVCDGIISPAYSVFRLTDRLCNPWYLNYLLRSRQAVDEFHRWSYGIMDSRLRLYPKVFLSLWLPVPPRPVQDMIVRYLDSETSTIDVLVDKTRQSIELLSEYRTALISAAVTGQIEIPAADSGEDVV